MTAPHRPQGPAAVLFDLEGVLIRHEVDIEEVRLRLAALFAPYGITRPFRPILRRIRDAVAEVGGELEWRAYAIVDEFELGAGQRARAKAGAVEVIDALATRRVALGLFTERGCACVAPSLTVAGIDPGLFTAIGAREDSFPPGPQRPVDPRSPWAGAPDYTPAILAAAEALAAADVWLIGDHPDDVRAAQAASSQIPGLIIRTALLRSGPPTGAAPAGVAPDQTLTTLGDVLALPGLPA